MRLFDFILYWEKNQSLKAKASKPYASSKNHVFDAEKMAAENGIGAASSKSHNGSYLAGGGTCAAVPFIIFLDSIPGEGWACGYDVCKRIVKGAIKERKKEHKLARRTATSPAVLAFLNFCR